MKKLSKIALALSVVGTIMVSSISAFAFPPEEILQAGNGYKSGSYNDQFQWDLYVNYGGASSSGSYINGNTGTVYCYVIVGGNYYDYQNENASAISMWGGEGQEAYVNFI